MILPLKLEEKIKALVESLGFELYDILTLKENEHQILRICITQKGGISLGDCQEVSLAISPLLDVEMPDFEKYYLEVSSPGIERILKTLAHYEGAVDQFVKIKTTQEIMGKKDFKGRLVGVDTSTLRLEDGVEIPLCVIKKAQTYFQW